MSRFQDLITKVGPQPGRGVPPAAIAGFEAKVGYALPDSLRALYTLRDGLTVDEHSLKILPLQEASRYAESLPSFWGYFPLTESNDSNPYCVCLHPPLAGYVVHVFHDDTARLAFRSLDSFMDSLMDLISRPEWSIDDLRHGYVPERRERSPEEIASGLELLRTGREADLEDPEHADAFRFGMTLLSEDHVAEIGELLFKEDHYVREDAVARLSGMRTPVAGELLKRYASEQQGFRSRCVRALKSAGFVASEGTSSRTVIRLEPGPIYMETSFFFDKRADPAILDDVVSQARKWLEAKKR